MLWCCGTGPSFVPVIGRHLVFRINPFPVSTYAYAYKEGLVGTSIKTLQVKGSISPFPVPSYHIYSNLSMGGSTTCVEFSRWGYKNEKINEIFKMGKKIFSVFLDGATHAAVSLAHFCKETALPIGPQHDRLMLIG